jgi:hypothetical protein
MSDFEKKIDKTLDRVGTGVNRAQTGCVVVLANLFFAAFCAWGAYAGYISWKLQTNGISVTGTVVQMREQSDAESGCCTYVPVVQFEANGQTFTFEGGIASDPPQYQVGESVPVVYDPADPQTAQINKGFERWIFPVLIIPAMLFAAIVVNIFAVRAWRKGEALMDG